MAVVEREDVRLPEGERFFVLVVCCDEYNVRLVLLL